MSTDTGSPPEPSLADFDSELVRTDGPECVGATTRRVKEPTSVIRRIFDGVSVDGTPMRRHRTPRDLVEAHRGVTPTGSVLAANGTRVIASKAAGNTPVARYALASVDGDRDRNSSTDVTETSHQVRERFGDGGSATFATGPGFLGDRSALIEGAAESKTVHAAVVEGS